MNPPTEIQVTMASKINSMCISWKVFTVTGIVLLGEKYAARKVKNREMWLAKTVP